MKNMIADGATSFLEIGPGKVLQGLLKKVSTEIETNGIQEKLLRESEIPLRQFF